PFAGCAILTGDLLRTSSTQRHKFIPWTDTTWTHPGTHHTHRGNNNRAHIASTAVHSADQAQLTPAHQPPPHATPACSASHRIADTTVSRTHSVGDGSVTNQGKPAAHGTWSYLGRDGTTLVGYVLIHPDHITLTPTRCEIHSLLEGLHHSGDTALQICDNTTAIGLVILARSLKRSGGQPRYSNIHRVELRSLMALLTPAGIFSGDWIRSHQDSTGTTDPVLC
ncbi:hypothetical protein DYB25_013696, partial [Aphanomyces astaci]